MRIIIYICGLLFITSCTRVLDQTPQDRISEQNFYKTATDAESAVVGIYNSVQTFAQSSGPQYPLAFDAGSDLDSALLLNYNPYSKHLIPVDDPIVQNYWMNNYTGIGRCNDVIQNVGGMDSTLFASGQKQRILGEAYFMRAYFYFGLIRAYGDVPIVTVPYQSYNTNFTIPRSATADVFKQILADLKIAEATLPVTYPASIDTRGRATQGGAKALLAQVYLSTKDYANAAAKALEVMNNSTYTLVTGAAAYRSMFSPNGKNGTESIFEIQYLTSSNQPNSLSSFYLPNGVPSGIQPSSYQIAPTAKIVNAFETGDIRAATAVARSTDKIPVPYVFKYQRLTNGTDQNFIAIRLAEIILLRAEALNNQGQTTDAIAALNIIRRRAFGLPLDVASVHDFPSANDLANNYTLALAIENERMKELCFEGQRFYDLARTGRSQDIMNVPANRMVWPIPLREIGRNPLLTQNEAYK
ncbi:MAG: RagB/SusD family nutrient uptake outer membrane protein [Niabella sp.]|nr:RagB/SusD family nutrient uptake outer membrane protein [Niabella sp.]